MELGEEFSPYPYKPDLDPEEHVIARYRVRSDLPLMKVATKIAAEESAGTWTGSKWEEPSIYEKFGAKVFGTEEERSIVDVAYPLELFDLEVGGGPQLFSVVCGRVFDLIGVDGAQLFDVLLPRKYVTAFKGPGFGVEGIRRTLSIRGPMAGIVIKPKVGLLPASQARIFYEAALGGVDVGVDGESLISQDFSPIEARASHISDMIDRIRSETGKKTMYAINVTAKTTKSLEIADRVIESGANAIMIDVAATGPANLQSLAEDPSITVPIYAMRARYSSSTGREDRGISMRVMVKVIRLLGGDLLTRRAARRDLVGIEELKKVNEFLIGEFHGLHSTLPVGCGGVHPGLAEANVSIFGKDQVILAEDGIYEHPWGIRAGATAMKQALDAVMRGESTLNASKIQDELRLAVEKWGYTPPEALVG